MNDPKPIQLPADRALMVALALIIGAASLTVIGTAFLPSAVDWEGAYRPAVLRLADLHSPYDDGTYHNPPWALLMLAPFSADETAGRAALFLVSVILYAVIAYHQGALPLAMGAFLLSPPILHTLLNGNIEWLVLAGLLMPPRWGLFFVSIKPQVAGMVGVFWVAEAWRQGGWRRVIWLVWPLALAYGISFVFFGLWPFKAAGMEHFWWNASFWPYSIPVGLAALAWSIWKRDIRGALVASPCLSPYVLLHAWSGALLAVVRHQRATLLVVFALWLIALRNL